MANTSSAKKAARKIARRAAINKNRRSRVRTYVRKVEEALAAGDKAAAEAAFKAAQPELMRAASKGVLHSNTASRKVSRLAQRRQGACPPDADFRLRDMPEPGSRPGFLFAGQGLGERRRSHQRPRQCFCRRLCRHMSRRY